MLRSGRIASALLAAAAAAVPVSRSSAQDTTRSTFNYSAEIAVRRWVNDLSPAQLGKFLEYKAVPSGAFVNNLFANYAPGDGFRSYQVTAKNIGQRDQSLFIRATQPGKFRAELQWDGIPHTFSTTARLLDTRPTPDVFTLSSPRPDTATWNRSGFVGPVRDLWQPLKLSLAYDVTPGWNAKAEYTRIARSGDKPISMSYGNSPGLTQREVMEPVDQTITNVRLAQSYSRTRFTFEAAYNLSMFDNTYDAVIADNPTITTDTPTGGSSRGRLSLAPDNVAHTAMAAAAVALPRSTRISAGGSYSMWRQDQKFLRATINSTHTDPRIDSMPASLGGKAGTSTFNIMGTTRPISSVTVTARARTFDFRDEASANTVPVFVLNDRTIQAADTTHRNPFNRTNADVKVTWRALSFVSLFAGTAYDKTVFSSKEANVEHYAENTPSFGLDVMGNQWVTVRASYAMGKRRGGTYDTLSYMPEFRRFYVADRDRTRFSLRSSVTPLDEITLSGTWEIGHDEYVNSLYGVLHDRSAMVGGDIDWTPNARFAMSGGLTFENFKNHMQDRYRSGTQLANYTFDWIADNSDVDHGAYAAIDAVFIPEKLTGNVMFQSSTARFRLMTYNPFVPAGGTASNRLAATASTFPTVKQLMQTATIGVSYRVTPVWAVNARLQGELYSQDDYRTDKLLPATANQFFLGNYFMDYNAQYLTFSVTYRPQAPKGVRSTL